MPGTVESHRDADLDELDDNSKCYHGMDISVEEKDKKKNPDKHNMCGGTALHNRVSFLHSGCLAFKLFIN